MPSRRTALVAALSLPVAAGRVARDAQAQAPAAEPPPAAAPALFGPKWDAARRPVDQLHFRDHSANLKKMRDSGQLLVGARYSDKGWIVVGAESEAAARALIEVDPSVQNGVFVFEMHPLNVFYPGCLPASRRG
jgi:uncharacterized protein YciI